MGKRSQPAPALPPKSAVEIYGPEPTGAQSENFDFSTILTAMMGILESATQAPQIPLLPSVFREPEIDFAKKQEQLTNKARADYKSSQSRKKGRSDTILTSPFIGEGETTESLLTGI